eukprot:scaffold5024_cov186-Skeletonema_marinoi.AAC.5
MSDSRRGQTRREEESRAAAVDNMSAPIAGSRSGRTQHVAEADGERTTSNSQNQSSNNSSPPSPWQHSTAKKRVIGDLKDSSSDIHLYCHSSWILKQNTLILLQRLSDDHELLISLRHISCPFGKMEVL